MRKDMAMQFLLISSLCLLLFSKDALSEIRLNKEAQKEHWVSPLNLNQENNSIDQVKLEIIPGQPKANQPAYLSIKGIDKNSLILQEPHIVLNSETGQSVLQINVKTAPHIRIDTDAGYESSLLLGSFPAGKYFVELTLWHFRCEYASCLGVPSSGDHQKFTFDLVSFDVFSSKKEKSYGWVEKDQNKGEYEIEYSYRRSVNEYNGFWYDPEESGRGFNIQNSLVNDLLVAAWYDYAADGSPTWFMLDGGKWLDDTTYEAKVFRHVGSGYDQTLQNQSREAVGVAKFHFTSPYQAEFTATVGGKSISKSLVKLFPQ